MPGQDTEGIRTIPMECPVSNCDYAPPAQLSAAGQEKALGRHIQLNHSISDLPNVVTNLHSPAEDKATEAAETPTKPQEPVATVTETPEPKAEAVGVQSRPARTESPKGNVASRTIAPLTPTDPKKERIEARAQKWGEYLYKDFNPLLVSGVSQFAGIPEPWLEGGPANGEPLSFQTPDGKVVTFWNPPLKQQLALSEGDAKRIAKAGATFAESPMGQALDAWLAHNAHYVALGAALWVAGSYGWRVMRIKTEVAQLKEVMEQQARMQTPPAASNDGPPEAAVA